jgi:hypothetical protein
MHWKNSQFQVVYFILGACHTPDEAYRKASELLEEREMALASVDENSPHKPDAIGRNSLACIEECKREIDFLKDILVKLNPLRKYNHLPLAEANQAIQREEWKLEFIWRYENYLLANTPVPHDQIAVMRQHPDFESEIKPYILGLKDKSSIGHKKFILNLLEVDNALLA